MQLLVRSSISLPILPESYDILLNSYNTSHVTVSLRLRYVFVFGKVQVRGFPGKNQQKKAALPNEVQPYISRSAKPMARTVIRRDHPDLRPLSSATDVSG